ncbi:hypothetical protein IV500_12870 [Paeniglutamicibacter antarcticus]|uniref:Uncharacterized protein n=1 Tax=Arthrobacter terrae TaxID=2935737 RepID=A0A931CUV3_9MICC|nr:hypothetical protein [Arthrobacter terrae]MBG0740273.1 hypothetical protein [Arthrobacter terrae]
MNKSDLEQAAQLAAETERQSAADFRRAIAEQDAQASTTGDFLLPSGREWVIAYDELKAVQDVLAREFGPAGG